MSDNEDYDDENYDPEAEVNGDWVQLNLPEVPVVTGEEAEEELAKFRSKLYRWRNKEWKERGIGELRFLKHKSHGKIRVLMRQEKTLKIVANFYVIDKQGLCQLTPQKTSDKAWIWDCCDVSDEKPQIEKLCAKFVKVEDFQAFKELFEKTIKENQQIDDELAKKEPKQEQENNEEQQKNE